LLAVLGLAEDQPGQLDAGGSGPLVIESVFGVDVAGAGAVLLGLGDDRQGQGGLAGAFGATPSGLAASARSTCAAVV
jgi:hypothetical protein